MNKTVKKALSIILTVLMIVSSVSLVFATQAEYEIKAGERITITIPQDGEGCYIYIKVVPDVSGIHTFFSDCGETGDPYAEIYDEDMNLINSDDDSKGNLNFKLQYELEAGKTYYLGVRDIQYGTEREWNVVLCNDATHIVGTQNCKGYKCEICESWYGEEGEHDLDNEQTCLGYYCYSCGDYYGEADPDAHNWNDTYCDICGDEHDHTGGTQTCKGIKCEICEKWYGEAGEQHDLSTEQTCMGYSCKYCYEWFGEADLNKHSWYRGYCDYCGIEYPVDKECTHDLDDNGNCIICGYQCPHEILENGTCTSCSYILPFSLTTGETVTYHGSFPDAFDNAENGSVIKLLRDLDDYNSVEINKEITLDLNGYTWMQPSSASHSINANVTFTDSVGGGYCYYGLRLNSPCTFSGGAFRNIIILFETEDTLEDYLAPCYSYYDFASEEVIDLSGQTYSDGSVIIKENHKLGEQTCKGYQCEDCDEYFGEADPDAHIWRFGECTVCEYACEHSFTKYTEKKAPTCTEAGMETAHCDYGCDAVSPRDIPALEHKDTLVQVDKKVATCAEAGYEAYEYCTACDYTTYKETPVADHIDKNGDYKCDFDCGHEFEKPVDPTPDVPDTPDEPADDSCDHICHKDGILGFFWKIISFLQRLFGIQQYCDCGASHYDAPVFG